MLAASALLALGLICTAFDWPAKPNDTLRQDMIAYANAFLTDYQGQPVAKPIRQFLKKRAKDKDPYAWMQATHQFVQDLKQQYPPAVENEKVRARILQLLDYPLHVNNYDTHAAPEELAAYYTSAQAYLNTARETVLTQLEANSGVTSKATIWKIYNCGIVIRTAHLTVGIDISDCPAFPAEYPTWQPSDYTRLAAQLDILFLTHPHDDHYALPLLRAMLDAGKPVVLPGPVASFTQTSPLIHLVTQPNTTPQQIGSVAFCSYPGNQGAGIPCNVYWLDIEGFRVVHNGDNYDRAGEAMMATLPGAHVVFGASWNDPQDLLTATRKASGAAGQLFIPMHENELGHSVNHRESYHELFAREDRLGNPKFAYPPVLLLDCGEHYTCSY